MNSWGKFIAGAATVVTIIGGIAGLYSPVKEMFDPKPEPKLNLVMETSDFSMPPVLDEIFDQVKGDRRVALDSDYALVAKYNPLNKVTYAGLYNNGTKIATDIKINFPGAHVLTVQEEGKELRTIEGRTDAIVDKLLPDGRVYFSAWGIESASNKDAGAVTAVYSNGRIDIHPLSKVNLKGKSIVDTFDLKLLFSLLVVAVFWLLYIGVINLLQSRPTK